MRPQGRPYKKIAIKGTGFPLTGQQFCDMVGIEKGVAHVYREMCRQYGCLQPGAFRKWQDFLLYWGTIKVSCFFVPY